ncbi:MAG: TetR family transcriptional regulator, partial [Planctomycetota bacterium]
MTAAETTRERLLDAAEACFAEIGFHAASVRMITERAGANLAAVHYHFGGKNGLIEAVITRRIGPVQAERLRRL